MWHAFLVRAVVFARDTVLLNVWLAVTARTAATELGVEVFQISGADFAHRCVAENRLDNAVDVADVPVARALLDVGVVQPFIDGVAQLHR